jgi:hypothetical protein
MECDRERKGKWKMQVIDGQETQKRNRTVETANPYFGCASIEVQGALFVDFGARIGRRNNLNTDLGSPLEQGQFADIFGRPGSRVTSRHFDYSSARTF